MIFLHISTFLAVIITLTQILNAERALFWRMYGRKLGVSSINKITVDILEDCLGFCESSDGCKAVNVNHISMVCELLALDRCDTGLELIVDSDSSYFDLLADKKCRKR